MLAQSLGGKGMQHAIGPVFGCRLSALGCLRQFGQQGTMNCHRLDVSAVRLCTVQGALRTVLAW